MIPHSLYGGRLVYSLKGVATTATDIATASPENTVVESNAGFTQFFGTTGAAVLDMPAASTAGGFNDSMHFRIGRAGMLCNQEILWSYTNDTDPTRPAFAMNTDGVSSHSGTDASALKMSIASDFDQAGCYTRAATTFTQQWNTGTGNWSAGARQWVRFVHKGNFIAMRVWLDGSPEPTAWFQTGTIDMLAAGVPTRGFCTLGLEGGNSGTLTFTGTTHELHIWDLDNSVGAVARGVM